jgi:hypothetical protein
MVAVLKPVASYSAPEVQVPSGAPSLSAMV